MQEMRHYTKLLEDNAKVAVQMSKQASISHLSVSEQLK